MSDHIITRLRCFHRRDFPRLREQFQNLVDHGQQPTVLFIGCSDSRVVPYLLMDSGPGELFIVRNVDSFVLPFDASHGYHRTVATIEYAVLSPERARDYCLRPQLLWRDPRAVYRAAGRGAPYGEVAGACA